MCFKKNQKRKFQIPKEGIMKVLDFGIYYFGIYKKIT